MEKINDKLMALEATIPEHHDQLCRDFYGLEYFDTITDAKPV